MYNTQTKKAAMVLRAVNNPLRVKILDIIRKTGRMTVTNLYVDLRLEQTVASQHLAILRKEGVVNTERDGKNIYYSVNTTRLQKILELSEELIK